MVVTAGLAACKSGFNESPTVSTQGELDLTPKSVTLTGVVNPEGGDTVAWFEWGTDQAFSNQSKQISVGSGAEDVTVTFGIQNQLIPNTEYQYRLVGSNPIGVIYGEPHTFMTPPVPVPIVITVAQTALVQTASTIPGCNWEATVNPQGFATEGWFEWWLDQNNKNTTAIQSLGSGIENVPLKDSIDNIEIPNTTFTYRAAARNEGGTAYGEVAECTTPPVAPTPRTDLPTISNEDVTNLTRTSATLNATINPEGTETLVLFEWWQDGSASVNTTGPLSLGNGESDLGHSANISNLTPDTLYHFRVIADGYGDPLTGTRQSFRTALPPAIGNLSTTNLTPSSVTLNVDINPHGINADAWFEWGTTRNYGNSTARRVIGDSNSMFTFLENLSGLTPNTDYHYRLIIQTIDNLTITSPNQAFHTESLPDVSTDSATNIGPTSATLNATVNPNGFAASAWFEWGIDTNYGDKTPEQDLGSGTSVIDVSATLTALDVQTDYHYRLVVRGYAGMILYGQDLNFITEPAPVPTAITLDPADKTNTACTLAGSVNPNGFETTAWFEWGTMPGNYNDATAATSIGNSKSSSSYNTVITGLSGLTTYFYRAVAENEGGESRGAEKSCMTAAPPPIISNLSHKDIYETTATVIWNTDIPATSQVEYGLDSNYGQLAQATTTLVNNHSVTLTGLIFGETYHFRVISTNADGMLSISEDQSFTTSDATTSINVAVRKYPSASSTYTGYNIDAPLDGVSAITMAEDDYWMPASNYAGEWYQVDLGGVYTVDKVTAFMQPEDGFYPHEFSIDVALVSTEWTTVGTVLTGTLSNGDYSRSITFTPRDVRYVRFIIEQGSTSGVFLFSHLIELEVYGTWVAGPDGIPPTAPTDLVATAADDRIDLAWTAATDNTGISSYYAERCQGQDCTNFTELLTVTSTTAMDIGLNAGATYRYRVRAMDIAANFSEYSAIATATTAGTYVDSTQPLISNITVSNITMSAATINWTTDEPTDGLVEYGITTAYGSSTPLDTTLSTNHSLSVTGLVEYTLYHYRIHSQDAYGNLSISTDRSFTTTGVQTMNLALNRPVTCISGFGISIDESGHPCTDAVDGDNATYWQSGVESGNTARVTVDLGAAYDIGQITLLHFGQTNRTEWRVFVSGNGSNYTQVSYKEAWQPNPIVLDYPTPLGGVRYIRVETTPTDSNGQPGFYEVQAFSP